MMQGSLAEKLRVLRARMGLSLTEAATRAGVTRDTLSDLEHGKRQPYMPTLSKIAAGYGVPVEDLLEEPVPLAEAPEAGLGKPAVPPRSEALQKALDDLAPYDPPPFENAYQPWLEFLSRITDRWHQKVEDGVFNPSEVKELARILEDIDDILIRLGRQENRENPVPHSTYGATISEAIRKMTSLFDPLIAAGTKQVNENDLARLRRERAKLDRAASGRPPERRTSNG